MNGSISIVVIWQLAASTKPCRPKRTWTYSKMVMFSDDLDKRFVSTHKLDTPPSLRYMNANERDSKFKAVINFAENESVYDYWQQTDIQDLFHLFLP